MRKISKRKIVQRIKAVENRNFSSKIEIVSNVRINYRKSPNKRRVSIKRRVSDKRRVPNKRRVTGGYDGMYGNLLINEFDRPSRKIGLLL